MREFSLLAEAACCAWEAMLEHRDKWRGLDALWERRGTIALRHECIALAPAICDTYDALGADWLEEHNLIPYDWEFVPEIVRMVYEDDVDPSQFVAKLRAKYEVIPV